MRYSRAYSPGHGDGADAFASFDLVVDTATGGAGCEHAGGAGGAHLPCASEPALLIDAVVDGSSRTAQARSLSDGNDVAATAYAVSTAIGGADREHAGGARDAHPFCAAEPFPLLGKDGSRRLAQPRPLGHGDRAAALAEPDLFTNAAARACAVAAADVVSLVHLRVQPRASFCAAEMPKRER